MFATAKSLSKKIYQNKNTMRKLLYILLPFAIALGTQAHTLAKETKAGYGICDPSPGVAPVAVDHTVIIDSATLFTPSVEVPEKSEMRIAFQSAKSPTVYHVRNENGVTSKPFLTIKVNRCKNNK